MFLELTDVLQRIHSVSRKAADGLCDDEVNLAREGILDHLVEAVTLLCVGAADSLVRIHPGELPIRAALNVVGVIIHLGGVGCLLVFVVRRNSCIRRHFTFLCSRQRHFRESMDAGRDDRHTSHYAHVLSIVCIQLAAAFEQHRISPASLAAHGRSR